MRNYIGIVVLFICVNSAIAGNIFFKDKINVKVINEDGLPVENAIFDGYFDNPSKYNGMGDTFKVLTNTNGESEIKGVLYGFIEGRAAKEGYYRSSFHKNAQSLKNSTNPTIKVVLRKKQHPHPMYVRKMDIYLPGTNEWYGFDFGVGDWVAPYGKGKENDIQVKISGSFKLGKYSYSYLHKMLYFRFATGEKDGIILTKSKMYSEFKSPYEAPLSGYSKEIMWEYERQDAKILLDKLSKRDECLIFRCRSKVDEEGELKEANYGKIYGEVKYGIGMREKPSVIFLYYFNPTPNDRNLEYEPDKNLFHERNPTKWQP